MSQLAEAWLTWTKEFPCDERLEKILPWLICQLGEDSVSQVFGALAEIRDSGVKANAPNLTCI